MMLMNQNLRKLVDLCLPIVLLIIISIALYMFRSFIVGLLSGVPGLLGFFILSFISCLSIAPIPYIAIVFKVARYVNPLTTSIVVGIGSALGEAMAWTLGRFAARGLQDTIYAKRVNAIFRFIVGKGSWALPLLAFIFSLTFLPDKLLYLPLGMMRYSIWKLIPFTALGKTVMVFLVLVFGRLWARYVEGYTNEVFSFAITTVVLTSTMIAMIYIDWEKALHKYLGKGS